MEKQWENKVQGLQAEITDHKHHLDQFKQQRTSLEREITKLKDELGDMEKMHFASSSLEEKRDKLLEKIEETELSTKRGQKLYQNYMSVYLMCQRHPAHAQALIEELENKLRPVCPSTISRFRLGLWSNLSLSSLPKRASRRARAMNILKSGG